jgi:hypothetical protein
MRWRRSWGQRERQQGKTSLRCRPVATVVVNDATGDVKLLDSVGSRGWEHALRPVFAANVANNFGPTGSVFKERSLPEFLRSLHTKSCSQRPYAHISTLEAIQEKKLKTYHRGLHTKSLCKGSNLLLYTVYFQPLYYLFNTSTNIVLSISPSLRRITIRSMCKEHVWLCWRQLFDSNAIS